MRLRRRVEMVIAEVEVGVLSTRVKWPRSWTSVPFVNILPGKDGLVHISQISDERVENVSDKLSEGDMVSR